MPGAHPAASRAEHLLELGRPDEALALIGPALTQQPDDAHLLTCAAYAHLLKEDWGQAAALGRRASAADPDDDRALRIQASALIHVDRAHEAAQLAHRAVQLAPHAYVTHLLYARCLSRIPGAHEQAWAEAMRTVAMAPNEPSAHILVAELAYPSPDAVNPQALDIAEQALQHALRLDPQNSSAMNDLARVRLRRSKRVGAMTGFSEALTADPHNDTALRNVGVVMSSYLVPAYWLVAVASFVSLLASGEESGSTGRVVQGGTAVVLLGVIASVVLRIRRGLKGRLGAFVRESVRHNRFGGVWSGTLALVTLCLTVVPLLPETAREIAGGLAVMSVLALSVAGVVWGTVLRWRNRRRRLPLQ